MSLLYYDNIIIIIIILIIPAFCLYDFLTDLSVAVCIFRKIFVFNFSWTMFFFRLSSLWHAKNIYVFEHTSCLHFKRDATPDKLFSAENTGWLAVSRFPLTVGSAYSLHQNLLHPLSCQHHRERHNQCTCEYTKWLINLI